MIARLCLSIFQKRGSAHAEPLFSLRAAPRFYSLTSAYADIFLIRHATSMDTT